MSIDPAWRYIENRELVASNFNELPSFHDAFIRCLLFESGDCNAGGKIPPRLLVDIDFPIFKTENGSTFYASHYIKVRIKFDGVVLARLSDFTYDNCLYLMEIINDEESDLLIVKMDSSSNNESFECELSCTNINVESSAIENNT